MRAIAETAPGEPLSITIPSELFGTRLLDALRRELPEASSRVTLEAHAPSLLAGTPSLRIMLEAFQDAGYQIAMRDFGTPVLPPVSNVKIGEFA